MLIEQEMFQKKGSSFIATNSTRLYQSFHVLQSLITIADDFLVKEKYIQAAVSSQIAALYASYNHAGVFSCPKLEEILRLIGQYTQENKPTLNISTCRPTNIKNVLHVLTAAKHVGGDTRFVWRWMQRDTNHTHSVALTRQMHHAVPQIFEDTVRCAGGSIHILDNNNVNVIQRGHKLRMLAKDFDAIFLHVYPEDVTPVVAFFNRENLPPIIFVVQADHQFWLGTSISDLFVHLRESGMQLSQDRRGIKRENMALLPIPLDPTPPTKTRSTAKKALGFAEDIVIILSIARAVKYESESRINFTSAVIPILKKHLNSVLLVVGPKQAGQWASAYKETDGRIIAFGQRSDTEIFYEAADIYLDSFPFSSNTSLLEAGSYGLPLVSYHSQPEDANVLGAGAPGLERYLLRVKSLSDYHKTLSKLIEHTELREKIGQQTKKRIVTFHGREGWTKYLDNLYIKINRVPYSGFKNDNQPGYLTDEVDISLHQFYSGHTTLGWIIGWYVHDLPYTVRLAILHQMLKIDRSFSFSMFLPQWLGKILSKRMKGWRELVMINKWLTANKH